MDNNSNAEKVKVINEKIGMGVKTFMSNGNYSDYLDVMSKFHQYGVKNTILIAMQKPEATRVAGFQAWKKYFGRNVRKGEKGIQVLAPSTFTKKKSIEKINPITGKPIIGENGKPVMEETEIKIPYFKPVYVFDVSQTYGKELPEHDGMNKNAVDYKHMFSVLNAKLLEYESISSNDELKDELTRRVESESVIYTVCQHYGINNSDYTFDYISDWSKNKELPEVMKSLKLIRDVSSEVISTIDVQNEHETELKNFNDDRDKKKNENYLKNIEDAVEQNDNNFDGIINNVNPSETLKKYNVENKIGTAEQISGTVPNNENADNFIGEYIEAHNKAEAIEIALKILEERTRDNLTVDYDVFADYKEHTITVSYSGELIEQFYDFSANEIEKTIAHNDKLKEISDKELQMPDKTTVEEMNEYGYLWDGMLPMDKGKALELFDKELAVYLLYPDGTESMAIDTIDIQTFSGLFGVEREEWEEYIQREAEAIKFEQDFSNGEKDGYALFQLKDGEELYGLRFASLKQIGGEQAVLKERYQCVYSAEFDLQNIDDKYEILNQIYDKFNIDHPEDFKGHSLSVSDVIAIRKNGETEAYYVDTVGFTELPQFLGETQNELVWDNDIQKTLEKQTEAPVQDKSMKEQTSKGMDKNQNKNSRERVSLRDRLADNKSKVSSRMKSEQRKPEQMQIGGI